MCIKLLSRLEVAAGTIYFVPFSRDTNQRKNDPPQSTTFFLFEFIPKLEEKEGTKTVLNIQSNPNIIKKL